MLQTIRDIYNFNDILYTLYLEWVPDWEVVNFVKENDITGIVMAAERYTDEFATKLKDAGTNVYVHTINDLDEANDYLSRGVDGIYTDFLMLED
jgi:glycerophosphoryl diester phosphodiesterase